MTELSSLMTLKRKIRLAHVIGGLNYGGAENQVVQILNGLNPNHIEKHLVTLKFGDSAWATELRPEITCLNVGLRRWGQVGCILRLARVFKHHRIDVVQSHMFETNLLAALAARLAGVPAILTTEHGKNSWKRQIHHFIEKRIISPLATRRIAVSRDISEIRVNTGEVPREKIIVIPNCVELTQNVDRSDIGKRATIGTVGRLVPAKDYTTLIKSFKILFAAGTLADLLFVGDGPERPRLELMVENLGLNNHVTFVGFQANVNDFLKELDVFVLSSITEGIPVAMLEAMAMGVPIVATKVGGIPEVIDDNTDGLLVDPRNPELLADSLKRLIEDESLRRKLSEAGRRKINNHFSRETICNRYEKLYYHLLKKA